MEAVRYRPPPTFFRIRLTGDVDVELGVDRGAARAERPHDDPPRADQPDRREADGAGAVEAVGAQGRRRDAAHDALGEADLVLPGAEPGGVADVRGAGGVAATRG